MIRTKAVFKGISRSEHFKFHQSRCLMTISVGQQTHEGERFAATVDLINNSFASCVILVDDSLQRHTMALRQQKDADYFYELSIKEGDLWLERNKKYYEQLSIPTKIMRWDQWLNHPDFLSQQEKIKAMLEENEEYKSTFYDSISEFVNKYRQRCNNVDFDVERAQELSFNFVLEECSALTLWPELQCHFEVYPNGHNQAIEATKQLFIYPYYPDLLQSLIILFRNAGQLEPQKFYFLQNNYKHELIEGEIQAG